MARTNTKRIRLTEIRDYGRNHELHCDRYLMLRTARKAGDEETVNHYVLGCLRRRRDIGELNFIEL